MSEKYAVSQKEAKSRNRNGSFRDAPCSLSRWLPSTSLNFVKRSEDSVSMAESCRASAAVHYELLRRLG